jgi:hypothetical protein
MELGVVKLIGLVKDQRGERSAWRGRGDQVGVVNNNRFVNKNGVARECGVMKEIAVVKRIGVVKENGVQKSTW